MSTQTSIFIGLPSEPEPVLQPSGVGISRFPSTHPGVFFQASFVEGDPGAESRRSGSQAAARGVCAIRDPAGDPPDRRGTHAAGLSETSGFGGGSRRLGERRGVEAVNQDEAWWASLPQPIRRRLVLLLTRDRAYSYLNKSLAVEITSTVRHMRSAAGEASGASAALRGKLRQYPHGVPLGDGDADGTDRSGPALELKRAVGHALA